MSKDLKKIVTFIGLASIALAVTAVIFYTS